jgi:hypothetical protein
VTWFRVDDSFSDHPKVEALLEGSHAEAAVALWLMSGSWCAKHLTDGLVPTARVRRFGVRNADKAAAELVRVRLWTEVDGGYQFHNWAKYQPSKAKVTADREAVTERVRKHRVTRYEPVTPASGNALQVEPVTATVTPPPTYARTPPPADGSRPVPTRPDQIQDPPYPPVGGEHGAGDLSERWSEPDAGQIQTRFKALYLARHRASPAMGGKSVHEFPERLLATAKAQGVEPLAMLEAAFERWQPGRDDKIARNAPYAAFCGRFGSLVDPTEHRAAPSGRKALVDAQRKALREHNVPEYERLNSALANFGKELDE